MGALFVLVSRYSAFPNLLLVLGLVLCFVGVFLIVIGSERHKAFALYTAQIGKGFRPLGLVAQACGGCLIYFTFAAG